MFTLRPPKLILFIRVVWSIYAEVIPYFVQQACFWLGRRGPFLKRLGNFSGPKANFKIKTCSILSTVPRSQTSQFCITFKMIETLIFHANRANINSFPGLKSYWDFWEMGPGAGPTFRFLRWQTSQYRPLPTHWRSMIFSSLSRDLFLANKLLHWGWNSCSLLWSSLPSNPNFKALVKQCISIFQSSCHPKCFLSFPLDCNRSLGHMFNWLFKCRSVAS